MKKLLLSAILLLVCGQLMAMSRSDYTQLKASIDQSAEEFGHLRAVPLPMWYPWKRAYIAHVYDQLKQGIFLATVSDDAPLIPYLGKIFDDLSSFNKSVDSD